MIDEFFDAVERGESERVRVLAAGYRRDSGSDGVLSHARATNPSMIPVLVSAGVPVDERDSVGGTILMTAAAHGKLDLIDWLCTHGADVNAANEDGETPFSFACAWDQPAAAERLILYGAHHNPVFRRGDTLLECAHSWSSRIQSLLRATCGRATYSHRLRAPDTRGMPKGS